MLEFSDIQGLVLSGHAHLPHARFLFLAVQDRKQAQSWLCARLPQITTAARRKQNEAKPNSALQIAFTAPGLEAFGLLPDTMQTFPREFQQGMGFGDRTRVLGDTGDSAPAKWQFGGPDKKPIHLLLLLYGSSQAVCDAQTQEVWETVRETSGLGEVYRQDSFRRGPYEAFGFRDGIAQPFIEGAFGQPDEGQDVLKAGEFLLGYPNEYGTMPALPSVPAWQDAQGVLPSTSEKERTFGRNSSYLVFRKLKQDVAAFQQYIATQTQSPDGTPNETAQEWLAAKMVGRWRSGAPLTLTPDKDDPALGADDERSNYFRFRPTDAEGYACPVGAHIRRANPRDTLDVNPEKSLHIANRHRLIRRGRPYEDPAGNGAEKSEGLLFVVLNADLQRQFEFIQQTWVNNAKFAGLTDGQDALLGDNTTDGCAFVIQKRPFRKRYHGLSRFVTVQGGGYFLLPGLNALRFLANLP